MKSGALASAALLLYLVSKPLWQFLKLLLLKRLPSSHTRYIPARVSPKSLNLFITSSQGKIEHNVHNVTLVDHVTLFNLTRQDKGSISQILVDLWRRGKNVVIARVRDKMIFYFFMTKFWLEVFTFNPHLNFALAFLGHQHHFHNHHHQSIIILFLITSLDITINIIIIRLAGGLPIGFHNATFLSERLPISPYLSDKDIIIDSDDICFSNRLFINDFHHSCRLY